MKSVPNTGRWLFCAGIVLSWPFLSGCDREDAAHLAFSHHLHVVENEMTCADCHGQPSDGRFASATHEACMSCHEDAIESTEIGEDTCGVCHKAGKTGEWKPEPAPEPDRGRGSFAHTAALSNRCEECHGSLLDEKLRRVPALTRDDKIRIRQQSHRGTPDCSQCHVDLGPDTPPANHQGNWVRRHGLEGQQKDSVCGVCHEESSCRECHESTPPVSHNNLWKQKTHGIQATWARERCAVCHEQDSCTACHEQVRPQSHNAAWEKTHCQRCHFSSSRGTGCAFCHEGDLLETHPNPHDAGWRRRHCQNCHLGSPELKQCEACHGQDLLDRHPNPHSSGWQERHCTTCHSGAPESGQCGLCHATTDEASHSNPHEAGWLDRHCEKCHAGAPESGQCGLCHTTTDEASHPNPHSAGFRKNHCYSCHPGSSPQNDCGACHPGGNNVQVHESFWDPRHDLFGPDVDCNQCHTP